MTLTDLVAERKTVAERLADLDAKITLALAARYAENWQTHAAHSSRYVGR